MTVVLTRRGDVYRSVAAGGGQLGANMQTVYSQIAFEVVPISDFDTKLSYAYQATHVLWVPRWLSLYKDDEVRYGQYRTAAGVQQAYRFRVNGKRIFKTGFRQTAYYVTERE